MEVAEQQLREAIALQASDLDEAVKLFSQAFHSCVEVCGELSPICGEYYLRYGTALFELAQMNGGVLGEKVEEEINTAKPAVNPAAPQLETEIKPLGVEDTTTEADAAADGGDDNADNADEADNSDEDEDSEEEEEEEEGGDDAAAAVDDGDIQIAWELLDTARVIYSGQDLSKTGSQLAEVYLSLADISHYKEEYGPAIQDYNECIRTLEQLTPTPIRRLSEAHYKLSLCFLTSDHLPEALKHCQEAANLLQSRQNELEETLAGNAPSANGDAKLDTGEEETVQRELRDIVIVMKELKIQIEDIEQSMNNRASMKAAIMSALSYAARPEAVDGQTSGQLPGAVSSSTASGSSRPAPQVLGVVGRGKNRITLAPMAANAADTTTGVSKGAVSVSKIASDTPVTVPKGKRSLEDLMSGAPAAGQSRTVDDQTGAAKQAKTSN